MKLIIILSIYLIGITHENDGKFILNFRLINYKNLLDVRSDGRNCEKFYMFRDYCDPIFKICITSKKECDILNKETKVFNNMKEIFNVFTKSLELDVWQKKISIKVKVDDQDSYSNIDHIAIFQEVFDLRTVGTYDQKRLIVNPSNLEVRLQATISTKCWPDYYGPTCDIGYNEYKCIKECIHGKCRPDERKNLYVCLCERNWTGLKCDQLFTTTKLSFSSSQSTKTLVVKKYSNIYKNLVKTTELSIFNQRFRSLTPFKVHYNVTPSKPFQNSRKIFDKVITKILPNSSSVLTFSTSPSMFINIFKSKTKSQSFDTRTSKPETISLKALTPKITTVKHLELYSKQFTKNYENPSGDKFMSQAKSVKSKIRTIPSFSNSFKVFSSTKGSTHLKFKQTQLLTSSNVISKTKGFLNWIKSNPATLKKRRIVFNTTDINKKIVKITTSVSRNADSVTLKSFNNFNNLLQFISYNSNVSKSIFNTSNRPRDFSKSSLKVSTKTLKPKENKVFNISRFSSSTLDVLNLIKENDNDTFKDVKKTTFKFKVNKLILNTVTMENKKQTSIIEIKKIHSTITIESNSNNASSTYLQMSVLKLLNQTFNKTSYLFAICGAFWICLIIMLLIIVIRKRRAVNRFDTKKFIYSHRKARTIKYLDSDFESHEVKICPATNPSIPFNSKSVAQKPLTEVNNNDNDEYETILRNLSNPNAESYVRLTYFSKPSGQLETGPKFNTNQKENSHC